MYRRLIESSFSEESHGILKQLKDEKPSKTETDTNYVYGGIDATNAYTTFVIVCPRYEMFEGQMRDRRFFTVVPITTAKADFHQYKDAVGAKEKKYEYVRKFICNQFTKMLANLNSTRTHKFKISSIGMTFQGLTKKRGIEFEREFNEKCCYGTENPICNQFFFTEEAEASARAHYDKLVPGYKGVFLHADLTSSCRVALENETGSLVKVEHGDIRKDVLFAAHTTLRFCHEKRVKNFAYWWDTVRNRKYKKEDFTKEYIEKIAEEDTKKLVTAIWEKAGLEGDDRYRDQYQFMRMIFTDKSRDRLRRFSLEQFRGMELTPVRQCYRHVGNCLALFLLDALKLVKESGGTRVMLMINTQTFKNMPFMYTGLIDTLADNHQVLGIDVDEICIYHMLEEVAVMAAFFAAKYDQLKPERVRISAPMYLTTNTYAHD